MARDGADNLEARLADLEARLERSERTVARLRADVARKDDFILFQADRIDD